MPVKTFTVRFATTSIGNTARPLSAELGRLFADHGPHFPPATIEGDEYQVRDLHRSAQVWSGTFGKLRDDAPNIVDGGNQEHALSLEHGDRLLEKCHFIYREHDNSLIWQIVKPAGSLSKAAYYITQMLGGEYVEFPLVVDRERLRKMLAGDVYEIDFRYTRPPHRPDDGPEWSQRSFDMLNDVHAAVAKIELRAERGGHLGASVKRWAQQMTRRAEVAKVKIRMTDETEAIDLVIAPVKDKIQVQVEGRYPRARDVLQELEAAYERNRHFFHGD